MTNIHPKFDALVERLVYKIGKSQTPVPGFVVGLSGTDSIVAFALCYEAMLQIDMAHQVIGVHYMKKDSSWFSESCMLWIRKNFKKSRLLYGNLPSGLNFRDEYRWADLQVMAKEANAWTVGTMNATEKALGKYSLLSTAVSIQPIQTLSKTVILEICEALGVPRVAIDNAKIPDCLCGRDEFAAENIELIDKLLRFESVSDYSKEIVEKAMAYISNEKKLNGFRDRVPYTI